MSRFDFDSDDSDDFWMLNQGRWDRNMRLATESDRGRAALKALEEALVALPSKRLIESHVAKDGDVCSMGAFALQRRVAAGEDRETVLAELVALDEEYQDDDGYRDPQIAWETSRLGKSFGMGTTLGWIVGEWNDGLFRDVTPEARYDAVLGRVREILARPRRAKEVHRSRAEKAAARVAARPPKSSQSHDDQPALPW